MSIMGVVTYRKRKTSNSDEEQGTPSGNYFEVVALFLHLSFSNDFFFF